MRNCVSNSTLVSSIVRPSILRKWDEGASRTQRVASGLVLGAHWVFECCSRARRTAIMLLGAKSLRALDMHQKIIAGARRPCKPFCVFTFRKGVVRFCFASLDVRLPDAALLRTPRAAAAQVRTPASFLKP